MRQRVMIAMALSCSPQLLIADEPTTALDVTIQAQIIDIVKRLKRELGMAIIWITHDLGIIAGLADRINVMYAGFVIESASNKEMFANPLHPYTLGLLGSIPRLDALLKSKLTPIEGLPPDLIEMPKGCPFYDRCHYRTEKCANENPMLELGAVRHWVACWNWQDVQKLRAAKQQSVISNQ
jgi:oligopeptide transport system ATP-binding protein